MSSPMTAPAVVPEGALGGGVEVEDAAAVVDRDHGVERGREHGPVAALADMRGLLGPPAFDREPHLVAQPGQRAQKLHVGLARGRVEQLDHGDHAAHAARREAQGGTQADGLGDPRAREVRVPGDVDDPVRLAGFPHAAGQALAGRERERAGDALERVVGRVVPPRGHAAQRRCAVGAGLPRSGEGPPQPLGHQAQDARVRGAQVRGLGERARDGLLGRLGGVHTSSPFSSGGDAQGNSASSASPDSSALGTNPQAPLPERRSAKSLASRLDVSTTAASPLSACAR